MPLVVDTIEETFHDSIRITAAIVICVRIALVAVLYRTEWVLAEASFQHGWYKRIGVEEEWKR